MAQYPRRVLVVGDHITDYYRFFHGTRICPEAPVPVLVKSDLDQASAGGAALVAAQLRELHGDDNVSLVIGSQSTKERIFADGQLVCRIDKDGWSISDRGEFYEQIRQEIKKVRLVIVSDYGKGAMDDEAAKLVMDEAKRLNIPVFVDAKHNWHMYRGAYAMFPNLSEKGLVNPSLAEHIIQKMGDKGCQVDGKQIRKEKNHEVRDVTGAGDIFLAAFAYSMLGYGTPGREGIMLPNQEEDSAAFAQMVAGISVEHLGTYVVKRAEIEKMEKAKEPFLLDKESGLWYPNKEVK